MSQPQSEETTPSNGASVQTAPVRYALDVNLEINSLKAKCTTCEMLTEHQWLTVQPQPNFNVTDPLEEVVSRARKILMCTTCGKLSLKS